MTGVLSVSIFLLTICLSSSVTVTDRFKTGTGTLTVTPVDGTHLLLDFKRSANLKNHSQLAKVFIEIDVSSLK